MRPAMTDPVAAQVLAILAARTLRPVSDIAPDMALTDLGMDSLSLVETIFALEESFDISVPFNANDPEGGFDLTTVGALIDAVQALVAARSA